MFACHPRFQPVLAACCLPVATRFVVLTNFNSEAVLDRETGLVWQRRPAAKLRNSDTDFLFCPQPITGARRGWRMPSVEEPGTLMDTVAPSPALPAGNPFDLSASASLLFWTSSTASDGGPTSGVWMDFGKGCVETADSTVPARAWLRARRCGQDRVVKQPGPAVQDRLRT